MIGRIEDALAQLRNWFRPAGAAVMDVARRLV
jgi:hypothetical protein